MLADNNTLELRSTFIAAWKKQENQEALSELEQSLVKIILQHPEYHDFFTADALDKPLPSDHNPFLHISLHQALREQLNTNRPAGIQNLFQELCHKYQDAHEVEHMMMHEIAQMIWECVHNNAAPNEAVYLNHLRELL